MTLSDYIKSDKGTEKTRQLELRSLADPLLSDALDGMSRSAADHSLNIRTLTNEICPEKISRKPVEWVKLAVLCFALAVIILVVFNYLYNRKVPQRTQEPPPAGEMLLPEQDGVRPEPAASGSVAAEPLQTSEPAADQAQQRTQGEPDPSSPLPEEEAASGQRLQQGYIFSISATDGRPVSVPRIGMGRFNDYLLRAMSSAGIPGKGETVVTFHVNGYGRPSGIRIKSGFSGDANREAIRLLESGPEWTPTGDQQVELKISF